jgi:hypothetical protein
MQYRLRKMDGNNNQVDDSTVYTQSVPATVPSGGTSFNFVRNRKYKIVETRVGTTLTTVKTSTTDASDVQTWTFTDPDLGPAGQAVGGWAGFACALGRSIRIEPVAGVPFCQ